MTEVSRILSFEHCFRFRHVDHEDDTYISSITELHTSVLIFYQVRAQRTQFLTAYGSHARQRALVYNDFWLSTFLFFWIKFVD